MSTNIKTKKSKSNVWKAILWVVLILFIVFLVHALKNFVITSKLQKEISRYTSSTNYHLKSIAHEEDGTIVTVNYYTKDGKQFVDMEKNNNGVMTKMLMYNNRERTDTFIETADSKTVKLNNGSISVNIVNYLDSYNSWQTFLISAVISIRNKECNGKDCYEIKNYISPNFMFLGNDEEIYLEKNTGLDVKNVMNGIVSEREYEFDNVNDSVFTEPDIGQYTIK